MNKFIIIEKKKKTQVFNTEDQAVEAASAMVAKNQSPYRPGRSATEYLVCEASSLIRHKVLVDVVEADGDPFTLDS